MMGARDTVKRFQREVQAAAALSHPNIVAAYDAHQSDEIAYLVLEYVEGVNLFRLVKEGGPLPVAVDLYLIHWPVPLRDRYVATWRALERIHREGRARAIGVSNFRVVDLERLAAETDVVPAVGFCSSTVSVGSAGR